MSSDIFCSLIRFCIDVRTFFKEQIGKFKRIWIFTIFCNNVKQRTPVNRRISFVIINFKRSMNQFWICIKMLIQEIQSSAVDCQNSIVVVLCTGCDQRFDNLVFPFFSTVFWHRRGAFGLWSQAFPKTRQSLFVNSQRYRRGSSPCVRAWDAMRKVAIMPTEE